MIIFRQIFSVIFLFLFGLSPLCASKSEQNYYRSFWRPTYYGQRLDYCMPDNQVCGLAVANQYCRIMGYEHAVQEIIDYNAGFTKKISNAKSCKGIYCNGFTLVKCVAKFSHNPPNGYYYRLKEFTSPCYNHSPVDWCYENASGCGKRAANSFCRRMGYIRAQQFTIDKNLSTTRSLGDHKLCFGNHCHAFKRIVCYR